ncbi:MAG: hypothetical protein EBW20_12465 [Betaproteobacteria bacterium]|nr:hypothetical protein [Betaproteobacteria bacterium]
MRSDTSLDSPRARLTQALPYCLASLCLALPWLNPFSFGPSVMVLSVFLFPLQPLMSWWSRQHEFEADAYAASQTDAADLESALIKLVKDNAATLTPDPLHSAVYDSHPPAPIRIARLQQLRLELGSTVPAAR